MARLGRKVLTFGLDEPWTDGNWGLRTVEGEAWLAEGRANLMKVSELKVSGLHKRPPMRWLHLRCVAPIGLAYDPLLDALFALRRVGASPAESGRYRWRDFL